MADLERYDFRNLHPAVRFGTASDRYAGWIGQIYPEGAYPVSSRSRRLGGATYQERQVPIASVVDYFEHFDCLELDFTFYRPLLEADGGNGTNYFVLQNYADAAPAHARFFVKAPQLYAARRIRSSGGFEANERYLDVEGYRERFLVPCTEVLGDRLAGVIFEQEYQRKAESPSEEEHIAVLDAFFSALPASPQTHLEMRSEHLITPRYVDWLRDRGLGFVFSHWTWLPSLKEQWRRLEGFPARDGLAVARLLTPRRVPYEKAYALGYPFDRSVPELAEDPSVRAMIEETTALMFKAIELGSVLNILVNNRAYGNAPELSREIAGRFLDVAHRRALGGAD